MGRRKKDANVSYKDIISSSYVRRPDYEKAQIVFSSLVDSQSGNNSAVMSDFHIQVDLEILTDDDDID